MPRVDVSLDLPLLVRLLQDPRRLRDLSPQQWRSAIDAAEHTRVLGWLIDQADVHHACPVAPDWLADRVLVSRALVSEYERSLRWEIDRLTRAFQGRGFGWVLLKGAAYVAARLPSGRGRRVADVDVLVPHEHLAAAEAALREHGWHFAELDAYDTRFYREWMHELPPMIHGDRGSVVDLHHSILPQTSRLHPPTVRLFERARAVDERIRVLSPAHMVLHAAAHLFHDGEIAGSIRDIVDLDTLFRCFDREPGFWDDFVAEARALELSRPAYYAVRYARRLLDTPVPADVVTAVTAAEPAVPVRTLMDALVGRTLAGQTGRSSSLAALALYVRSHWLRMPPLLLARHLLRKSMRRESI